MVMKLLVNKLKEKVLKEGKTKKNVKIIAGFLVAVLGGVGITVSEEGIGNVVAAVMDLF